MRRLAFAAVCGTLVLAACSDQSPTEPTAPPEPEQNLTSCRPPQHFPILQVSALIVRVFPKGKLQIEALARAAATALLWETCHTPLAQRSAVEFVNFMNANKSKLTGTQSQQNTLISLVLNGVDIPFTTPPGGTGDFGVGFFDPGKTTNTLVVTQNGTALVELEPGSFNQPTTIVVSRKSDGFTLTNFDGNQFPPYFDYDAINAAGDHVLKNGKLAIVAFCLLDPVYTYPENPRIGHNPVAGAPGFPFEVLEEVNLAADHPDLAAQLNCGNLEPNTVIIGGFGRGLPGLASAAWRTARYYLAPAVQTLFLPEALHAATLAVGTLPPPAGRAPSLSPFGIVEVTSNQIENSGTDLGSEGAGPYYVGEPLDTCSFDSCFPEFRVTDGEVPIQTPTNLTVSLVPGEGSTGILSGTTPKFTSATSPYTAEFNDLTISAPGTYQLLVSGPGVASYTTGSFTVTAPPANELLLTGDPGDLDFLQGSILSFLCGELTCYPAVRLVDWKGDGVPGVNVTVTLDQVEAAGSFESGNTTMVSTSSDPAGYAVFDNLSIDQNGSYALTFSTAGVTSLTTGSFFVLNLQ